jgi:Abnormal spindle-like microcephaly-assoc'd, ASPM-SPD-2-Hydin
MEGSQDVMLSNPGPGTVTAPTITVTGANAGDFSEKNACGSELLPGTSCQVTVTFSPTRVGGRTAILNFFDNASGSPQKVTLTGSGPDFSATAPNPASLIITAGQAANYTFGVAPLGGFNQTVAMTCSGAPPQSKCTLPTSIMLNGSDDVVVEVTVSTTARSTAMNQLGLSNGERWLACGLFGLPLMVVLTGGGVRGRRFHAYRSTLLLLVVAAMLLMPACGGGSSGGGTGTPTGTYRLTVTGKYTSGGATLTHSTTLALTVQ